MESPTLPKVNSYNVHDVKSNPSDDRRMSVPCQIPDVMEDEDDAFPPVEEGDPSISTLDSNTWPRTRSKLPIDDSSIDVCDFIPYHLLSSENADAILDTMSDNVKELLGAVCPMSIPGEYLPEVLPCDEESWFGDSLSTELLTPGASLDDIDTDNIQTTYPYKRVEDKPIPGDANHQYNANSNSYVPSLLNTIANSVTATANILDTQNTKESNDDYEDETFKGTESERVDKVISEPTVAKEEVGAVASRCSSHEYSSADGGDSFVDEQASSCSFVSGDFSRLSISSEKGKVNKTSVASINDSKSESSLKVQGKGKLPLASAESLTILSSKSSSEKEDQEVVAEVRHETIENAWDADYDEPPEETPDDFFTKDDQVGS